MAPKKLCEEISFFPWDGSKDFCERMKKKMMPPTFLLVMTQKSYSPNQKQSK